MGGRSSGESTVERSSRSPATANRAPKSPADLLCHELAKVGARKVGTVDGSTPRRQLPLCPGDPRAQLTQLVHITPEPPKTFESHDYDYPPGFEEEQEDDLSSSQHRETYTDKKPPVANGNNKCPPTLRPAGSSTLPSSVKSPTNQSPRNSSTLPSTLAPGGDKLPPPVPNKPQRSPKPPGRSLKPPADLPDSGVGSDVENDEANPWRVNLKKSLKPNLLDFKGEKCFFKDTAVTNVVLHGFESSGKTGGSNGSLNSLNSAASASSTDVKESSRTKKGDRTGNTEESGSYRSSRSSSDNSGSGVSLTNTDSREKLSGVQAKKDEIRKSGDRFSGGSGSKVSSSDSGSTTSSLSSLGSLPSASVHFSTPQKKVVKMELSGTADMKGSTPRKLELPNMSLSPQQKEEESSDEASSIKSDIINTLSHKPSPPLRDVYAEMNGNGSGEENGVDDGTHGEGMLMDSEIRQSMVSELELDMTELSQSQQDLIQLHQRMKEERKQEQMVAEQEKHRLDDILNMCAEYERQLEHEKRVKEKVESPTERRDSRNSMTKIKTNGSLTKLASPNQSHKDIFDFKFRRSSGSSASTSDDEGSDNGTIKRRPNGAVPGTEVHMNGSYGHPTERLSSSSSSKSGMSASVSSPAGFHSALTSPSARSPREEHMEIHSLSKRLAVVTVEDTSMEVDVTASSPRSSGSAGSGLKSPASSMDTKSSSGSGSEQSLERPLSKDMTSSSPRRPHSPGHNNLNRIEVGTFGYFEEKSFSAA